MGICRSKLELMSIFQDCCSTPRRVIIIPNGSEDYCRLTEKLDDVNRPYSLDNTNPPLSFYDGLDVFVVDFREFVGLK